MVFLLQFICGFYVYFVDIFIDDRQSSGLKEQDEDGNLTQIQT